MASMKRPRLKDVQALAGHRLALTFINDQRYVLDMSADVQAFPGLQPLKADEAFAQAHVGDDGWTVEWPELDIQIGADTLYLDAQAQAATDENTRISSAGVPVPGCRWPRPRRWDALQQDLKVAERRPTYKADKQDD